MCLSCEVKPIYIVDGEPGLVPHRTCWERRDANIDLVSAAYQATHDAMIGCASSVQMMVKLEKAVETVGECLDELMRERQAWQERQALREKEHTRGIEQPVRD